jgi:hypothetical protein
MHDEGIAASRGDAFDEIGQRGIFILFVDADAAFHGDFDARSRDRLAHRRDAFGDERRLAHEAGAEAARLHAIGRTTDVEVDFVVAELGADARRLREFIRIAAAQLQRHRMFARIETEQALAIAVDHRERSDHLGIQQRVRGEQAMEEPAVTIAPIEHRRHAYGMRRLPRCSSVFPRWGSSISTISCCSGVARTAARPAHYRCPDAASETAPCTRRMTRTTSASPAGDA